MNRKIFLAALGAAAFSAQAGDIEGRVSSVGGQPQSGAVVRIKGTSLQQTTDARGHFHFDGLTAGVHTLEVETGGDRETREIEVPESGVVSINIEIGVQLAQVEISASAFGTRELDLAQPVEIISRDELRLLAQPSIGETLSSQLGVTATWFGPAAGRPVVRGLTGSRVRMQQDGISAMDVSALSPDHAVALEPLLVDSVEVVKGPATLLYGNGAFGGVINMNDSRIPEQAPFAAWSGMAELRGDTAANERAIVARADGGNARFAWHMDAFSRQGDDVEIPVAAESKRLHEDHEHADEAAGGDFVLENSDYETVGGALGASLLGENGFLGFSVSRYESDYGIPGHVHPEGEEEETAHGDDHGVRVDLRQTRYDIKGRRDNPFAGIETLKFRAGYNDYRHDEVEDGVIATTFTNREFDSRLEMVHGPLAGWRGAFGIQLNRRDFSALGEEAYIAPAESVSLGVFLVEEREFGDWRAEVGGRFERQRQDAEGFAARDDDAFSVSGGLVRRLDEQQSLGINLTRAQRIADIEERYANGPHLATLLHEIGNPGLGKETANNIDLTWRKRGDGINWTANLFYNRVNDFIYLEYTDEEIDALAVARQTQADAVLKGFEAELVLPLLADAGTRLDLRLFSDYTRGTLVDGGNLPRIPPLRFGAGLDYVSSQWTAGIEAVHYAEQDRTAQHELPTDAYTMLNASISWRVLHYHTDWDFFLRASNLLDEEARRHSSFVKDLAPLPGRNFSFGIRAGF